MDHGLDGLRSARARGCGKVKTILFSALALLVLAIGGFAFFNGFIYPPSGLHGFSQEHYAKAWEATSKGFCASSDLTYSRPDFIKFRKPDDGSEAYVWGVARCHTRDGRERLAWIYLEWSTKRLVWTRSYTLVLADDDDEVYYTPAFPGQFRRAWTALSKIMQENARHVREYLNAQNH